MTEITKTLKDINELLTTILSAYDLPVLQTTIKELETKLADPKIWEVAELGQKTTSELAAYKAEYSQITEAISSVEDLNAMYDLYQQASETEQAEILLDLQQDGEKLLSQLKTLEVRTLLSGKYDSRSAIVTIRAGAGGEDAADWANMLYRMYTRWASKNNYSLEVYDISSADGGGIKSVSFVVNGVNIYGLLSVEAGIHRLVRISPFDSQARRHTSFAEVEVLPVVDTTDKIEIADNDIRVDVYRSSGPGGQSVNTTDSAVRITHIPTGIVVTCQNEKSQLQNKNSALRVLQSKLLEKKRKEEQQELASLKGTSQNSWGGQMRSYVLHPYQMVKDLRTDYTVGNPQAVLDGDIDDFIAEGIKWKAHNNITS